MIVGRLPGHPAWCAVAHAGPVHIGRMVRCWSTASTSIVTHVEQRATDDRALLVISVANLGGVTVLRLPFDQALSLHTGMRACLTRAEGSR